MRDSLLRVFLRDTVARVSARSKSGFCHTLQGNLGAMVPPCASVPPPHLMGTLMSPPRTSWGMSCELIWGAGNDAMQMCEL